MQYLSKDKHSRIASEKKRCESEEREEREREDLYLPNCTIDINVNGI